MSLNMMTWARARLRGFSPPIELTEEEAALPSSAVRRGLRLSIAEGALASVHINISTGVFLTGFALLLGADAFQLGLLGALPFLGQICQFLGAYLQERIDERRKLVTLTAVGSRLLWLPIAVLPFLNLPGATGFWVFLLLLTLSQVLLGVATNGWLSWMSDLVPARQRGAYFGFRNTICSITAMASIWLAGTALDVFVGTGSERTGYLMIFGVAVAFALAAGVILWRQPEPPVVRQQRMRLVDLVGVPLRHARFRAYCSAALGWAIVTGISAPFFNAYGIEALHLPISTLALMGVVTSAITLVTQPLIGRLQDRYGDKRVLVACVVGVILMPWGWVLSTPTFLLPIWVGSVLSGVFWPGVTQGLFNLLIDRSSSEGRGAYIAAYGVITGIGAFSASLLGGVLATIFAATSINLGLFSLGGYAVLFALSSLGRAVMAYVFWRRL